MTFSEQSFASRYSRMGDEAEAVFMDTYPQNYVRYGLDRPPINLSNVPAFVRYTPDFATAKGLVEVQGMGRDQVWKLKHDKWQALRQWNRHFRTDIFSWDSKNKTYAWVRLVDLDAYLAAGGGSVGEFPEGKSYIAIPRAELPIVGDWAVYAA